MGLDIIYFIKTNLQTSKQSIKIALKKAGAFLQLN